MKKILQQPRLLLGSAVLFSVLLAGCGDKHDTATGTGTTGTTGTGSTAAMPAADNTAKNARDRDDATLTAGDQGNSPADRETTQKIRRALVSDSSGYSMAAKNVKIITVNGKVSLRGPVNTAAEKAGIVALAATIAGPTNVDDQLELKK